VRVRVRQVAPLLPFALGGGGDAVGWWRGWGCDEVGAPVPPREAFADDLGGWAEVGEAAGAAEVGGPGREVVGWGLGGGRGGRGGGAGAGCGG